VSESEPEQAARPKTISNTQAKAASFFIFIKIPPFGAKLIHKSNFTKVQRNLTCESAFD
jgi:hypothetical protein